MTCIRAAQFPSVTTMEILKIFAHSHEKDNDEVKYCTAQLSYLIAYATWWCRWRPLHSCMYFWNSTNI